MPVWDNQMEAPCHIWGRPVPCWELGAVLCVVLGEAYTAACPPVMAPVFLAGVCGDGKQARGQERTSLGKSLEGWGAVQTLNGGLMRAVWTSVQ